MKSRIAVSILSLSVAVLSLLLGGCYGKEPVSGDFSGSSSEISGGFEISSADNGSGFFSESPL